MKIIFSILLSAFFAGVANASEGAISPKPGKFACDQNGAIASCYAKDVRAVLCMAEGNTVKNIVIMNSISTIRSWEPVEKEIETNGHHIFEGKSVSVGLGNKRGFADSFVEGFVIVKGVKHSAQCNIID